MTIRIEVVNTVTNKHKLYNPFPISSSVVLCTNNGGNMNPKAAPNYNTEQQVTKPHS